MTKGSVIVNGVRYEDTLANIIGDDTPKTPANLQNGMVVKVTGRRNDDGTTGTADRIEIENEVRGPIGAILPPDSFTVLGQTVFVDGGTIFANVSNFGALVVGDSVEVHGARDAGGNIRATRVEKLGAAGVVDEVKGGITAKTGTTSGTITIGGATFTFDDATVIVPAGAAFGVGTVVEVHLDDGTLRANRIEVEDFGAAEGEEAEVEGFVTGFTSLSSTFFVGGVQVDASNTTRFEGGLPADLANDVKVEAEGHMVGGILVADKIEFKDAIRIESTVQSTGAGSFTLLGKTIFVTGNTENNHGAISANDNVRVRGFLNQDNATITATRVDSTGPIDNDRHIVQALVGSFDVGARHLTLLGVDVDATGAQFRDDRDDDNEDLPLTAAQFFGALTEGRTVVKARGTPAGTPVTSLIADQVEIE
jgi:hypothetical protein